MSDNKTFVRKSLWLATNFAGKMIRENGYFNKAVSIASDYYNESEEDIKEQLRLRQSKGQTGKSRGKYKYYCIKGHHVGERGTLINGYMEEYADIHIVKALNKANAIKKLCKDDNFDEYGSWFEYGEVIEFENKNKAEIYCKENQKTNY